MLKRSLAPFALAIPLALVGGACSSDSDSEGSSSAPSDVSAESVVALYADGVHASYAASLTSAQAMDVAIDAFLTEPTDDSLEAAKQAWLDARDDYNPTEAFRFYDGPIDNAETGKEGQINAWPMDEAYVDYVEGDASAGIINDPEGFPTIDADVLAEANEAGGETNISTGWHAIEFLLWGQDLSADGPGERPSSDYTDAPNADRRSSYLEAATDLLVADLSELVDAWAPDTENYRAEFVAEDTNESLRKIITGVGELSRGELAGERMNVAYEARSQEDEHSCFSDNTTNDIIGNATGIVWVLEGSYPGVEGPGVLDLVAADDKELAESLASQIEASVAAAEAIPAPFDQHLAEGVSDDDEGRAQIEATIVALEDQTDDIVAAATALGVNIEVS